MLPSYWADFIEQHQLVHREVSIPEQHDLSGIGVDLHIFDAESAREEAEEAYPGIAVAPDGFIPVAGCCIGSGDPFFINTRDGANGPLYQIYHDAVSEESYDPKEAIAIVLKNYEDLHKFVDA